MFGYDGIFRTYAVGDTLRATSDKPSVYLESQHEAALRMYGSIEIFDKYDELTTNFSSILEFYRPDTPDQVNLRNVSGFLDNLVVHAKQFTALVHKDLKSYPNPHTSREDEAPDEQP
ncbi:hypothetical protein ACFO1B_15975 [Dactylosporangium siamense]|uniref:Uncharacterized protein n=1 Tax=Dactylosporangium siamense TaxID=685454 RepID=A0A919PJK4_9ACTN|nr:hypothetical protein [Dactylosporangium siamense]GIG45337.1 hypothetical protein Dsi01nite_033780 [Dactylosporangium siamense]